VPGWRYQLALFANVAARDQHADLAGIVDRYFEAWSEPDGVQRQATIAALATEDLTFKDAFGCTAGRDDLLAHIAAVQLHMPGTRLTREGEVRQCQGTAIVDWVARTADGQARGQGTNVFALSPDGRVAQVVGFRKD
jgi:hypothetical protein